MNGFLKMSVISGSCIFLIGALVGFFLPRTIHRDPTTSGELRVGSGTYTNALLECEIARDSIAVSKKNFTRELEEMTEQLKEEKKVSDIAVYYRDLNNGPVVSVNEHTMFAPASLLKLPLLIAYLYWEEQEPGVLNTRIFFDKPFAIEYVQEFPPENPLIAGNAYSVRELLERAVRYSDNQAYTLLFKNIPTRYPTDLFLLLGIDPDIFTDLTQEITIRQYSSFFRILFNVSFLSFVHSEDALHLLTQTSFTEGIVSGVPKDIPVAHKFGERKTKEGIRQFHDCGIVYYPTYPYLLCVMTRGDDTHKLVEAIRDVSSFVYTQVDSEYGR